MYLWRQFDVTSEFLFNKLLPLPSNISIFSFKPTEHLFAWGLYSLNLCFTAHVTFALQFPAIKFQWSTDILVSFLYLLVLNDLLWSEYRFNPEKSSFLHKFLCNFWVFHGFCHMLLSLQAGCFLGGNFRLSGRCFCWYNCIFGGVLVYWFM